MILAEPKMVDGGRVTASYSNLYGEILMQSCNHEVEHHAFALTNPSDPAL